MSQSAGPRIVAKYVEGVTVTYTASGNTFAIGSLTPATGWTNPSGGVLQWQGYIDISGYRPDDMVLIPTAVQCQYGGAFLSSNPGLTAPGGNIYMQYAITTDKVDDIDFGASGNVNEPLVGFMGDNSEMEQVIYAATEVWGPASQGLACINQQKTEYGDAPPIVGPRIYVTIRMTLGPRIASCSAADTFYAIPPMRFVIGGQASEVPMFQLMHLMKRQIDLQQTSDVDN